LSFFPIILAGPIQRPASLLPQISRRRQFNYDQAASGLWQTLWGLFTKVVIADNLALLVNDILIITPGMQEVRWFWAHCSSLFRFMQIFQHIPAWQSA